MTVRYVCRYCGMKLGEISAPVSEHDLGFDRLTPEERQDILRYGTDGTLIAQVVCEYCQETLERNPEWVLMHKIHQ